jgi:hypothetical protein
MSTQTYTQYFVKNYKIKEVIDLFCYGTRFPHTLSSTQKITRLYRYSQDIFRCILRRQNILSYHDFKGETTPFHSFARESRIRFDRLM